MQRWVHEEGWTTLHDAQERAIEPILSGNRDLVIAAATAAGKTEAAFLPICSALAFQADADSSGPSPDPWARHDPWETKVGPTPTGIQVLYLSPLKALINDQFQRLEELCERAGVPVYRWHGDVSDSAKSKVRKDPAGVLLITPESLEATFVNRGAQVAGQFAGLRYVVVDELHSFLGQPRGAQLQSLLGRIELAIRRRPPRIGLSATLGDMDAAARFLRPTDPDNVLVITSEADHQELKLQIRGYRQSPPQLGVKHTDPDGSASRGSAAHEGDDAGAASIADHLFKTLRGTDNLVFSNRRAEVEQFADLLARRCEAARLPNEFWPHHGSLAKDVREIVEAQLKDRTRPVTAICTSTLEMGIDIGSVASVAQLGPPPSVAALRQRLGRSGRRGEAAVLRMYVDEPELDVRSNPIEQLRTRLVQGVAMTQLLLERWLEPPDDPGLNLSTLIQQTLSLIAQHGGVTPSDAHRALCGAGPFAAVDAGRYAQLLRAMAANDLVVQATDSTLLPGSAGERAVNHYSFYSAFQTAEEWRLVTEGRTLGSIPITEPLIVGGKLIFAGRRWKIASVDTPAKVIELARASGGTPPRFGGGGPLVSDRVRAEMVKVYESSDTPAYLDPIAQELLAEARATWTRLGLSTRIVLPWGTDTFVLPWVGDAALGTLAVMLRVSGVDASREDAGLLVSGAAPAAVHDAFLTLREMGAPDETKLAHHVENREIDKWDWVLDGPLSAVAYGARALNVAGAWGVVEGATEGIPANARPAGEQALTWSAPPTAEKPSGAKTQSRAARQGGGDEFCVVDVETTGFSPRLGDRVIEVAAVRIRRDGTFLDEWTTLLNPSRDIGATHVHGIRAGDVVGAPEFREVAGDLLERLEGAVVVAHNLRFDWGFLSSEYSRAGASLPALPGLCTLALGHRVDPGGGSRKLSACCAEHGIDLTKAHAALDDARAAAKLLATYLDMARGHGLTELRHLGCQPLSWPDQLPELPRSGRCHPRGVGADRQIDAQASYLSRLLSRVDGEDSDDPDTAAYLDVLDRALEDRRLTADEAEALAATAQEWGLSAQTTAAIHERYLNAVCDAAIADGVVTDAERADLQRVTRLLALPDDHLEGALASATRRSHVEVGTTTELNGLTVCFSGASTATFGGVRLTKDAACRLATEAGLHVTDNVTKATDLLVVVDPDTQSGKARKARELGVRVMTEAVFWRALGVDVK